MVVTSSNTATGSASNSVTACASTSATPLSNTKAISPSQFKSIFLHEWWLVKPKREGIAVGGVASTGAGERVFLSTLIAKRHEANILETEDGITIIFSGFINTSRTCENGFPSQLCQHFLFGFPHDWKKYTVHSFGGENIDGVTGFGDSNTCSQKKADDALPFSIHDNDLSMREDILLSNNGVLDYCSAPKEICNGLGNVSDQFKSTDIMECNVSMKNMECECKENNTTQKLRQPQVDMMHNSENGISDVVAENVETGQSLMGVYDPNPCTVSTVKSPISTNKMRKGQLSSNSKEKRLNRQKISEDAVNTSSRMVKRSISKRSHALLKEDEKVTVRRSPRLSNRRK